MSVVKSGVNSGVKESLKDYKVFIDYTELVSINFVPVVNYLHAHTVLLRLLILCMQFVTDLGVTA